MIKLRHQQPSLWHRGLAEDIEGLWEPWMRLVDELLEDEQLVDTVYEAQGERHPQSRMRGRMQTPAEVVLRLLLLKHIRNWSYDVLEREVRANLVYRAFTRIGDEKVPDAKTLARLGQLIEPRVVEQLHQRVVELAQERGVTEGKKLRVDTTVVESNIHYPTDSSLLGDGTRVLTRTMKKIESKSGGLKRKVRDRMRSIRKRVLAIALSTRLLGPPGEERRKRQYRELLSGKPNRNPLRGVCRASCGLDSVAVFDRGAPTEIGTNPARGGCRCGILFARERESGTSAGGAVDVGAQQENHK